MSVIHLGNWCGYCANFVQEEQRIFLAHLDMCEMRKCDEIKNYKEELNRIKKLKDNSDAT